MKGMWRLLALFAGAMVVLAVACGGDDDDSESGDAGGPTSGGGSVTQVLDLTTAAEDLLAANSFRFDIALNLDFDLPESGSSDDAFGAGLIAALLGNVEAQGAYVGPDSFEIETSLFGQNLHLIQIGSESWIDDGSGWRAADAGDTLGFFGGGNPTDFALDMLPQEVLTGAEVSSESVNGIDATRYSFDKAALETVAAELGEDLAEFSEIDTMNLDVWVSEAGIPVKVAMRMEGESEGSNISMELDFNILDLDSGDISIERPI